MRMGFAGGACIIASLCLWVALAPAPGAHSEGLQGKDATAVSHHASGTFEVKVTPQPEDAYASGGLSRMTIDKQFHGALEGTSKGQMLASGTGAKDSSGGYVAIERVSGKLDGRAGTFVLQHSGTMTKGVAELKIFVVPDSGTGELAGLAGSMKIIIASGKHSYDFEYTLQPGQ